MTRLRTICAVAMFMAGAVVYGCADFGWIDLRYQPNVTRKDTGQFALRRVQSADDWVSFFRDQIIASRQRGTDYGDADGRGIPDLDFVTFEDMGAQPPQAAPSGPGGDNAVSDGAEDADGGSGGGDYTSTNIQEIGVDEADVVKTDGEYFYMLVGSELRIVRAHPVDQLAELSALELDGEGYYNSSLYLNGDRLVAITQPAHVYYYDDVIFAGVAEGMEVEAVQSDRPADGGGSDSAPDGDATDPAVDGNKDGDATVDEPQVLPPAGSALDAIDQFGLYYENERTIVTLVDVSDRSNPTIEAKWTFDGYHVTSRMVEGALHLVIGQSPYIPWELDPASIVVGDIAKYIPTYQVTYADGREDSGLLVHYEDFYYPSDPDGYSMTTLVSLDTNEVANQFASVAVLADPGTIYASTNALYLTDPDYDYFYNYRETLDIHKFAFTADGASYVGSGSVDGRLLNQFSLGEFEGHLRVATTTGTPWAREAGEVSKNHVFVLGEGSTGLQVVGTIDDIAPGEQIYSARFVGSRGFMVTFRQVDPLYTLDLSNPTDPRVAGELKVPGFSEYIHILDDDHLLTLGRAATDEGVVRGLQLSIFDVSNLSDPQLVASKEIGGQGTQSEAEYNHKAFTYYPAYGLLAIPVDMYDNFWEYEFSGLQVYHVSPQQGIDLAGQIATGPIEYGYPLYWGWTRGIFIDDMVYAVTEGGVKTAPITDPSSVAHSIDIEGSPYKNIGPYPLPVEDMVLPEPGRPDGEPMTDTGTVEGGTSAGSPPPTDPAASGSDSSASSGDGGSSG